MKITLGSFAGEESGKLRWGPLLVRSLALLHQPVKRQQSFGTCR